MKLYPLIHTTLFRGSMSQVSYLGLISYFIFENGNTL